MSMTRHLDDSTLMSFAAGSLPAGLAVVAAAHVAICTRCRDEVAMMERLGGVLLGAIPGAAMRVPVPAAPEMERHLPAVPPAATGEVPAPLARLVGDDLDACAGAGSLRGPGCGTCRSPAAAGCISSSARRT
jgi:putative transcriptional regulator